MESHKVTILGAHIDSKLKFNHVNKYKNVGRNL